MLRALVERQGSDLHLRVGRPPLIRLTGELLPTEFPPVTADEMLGFIQKIVPGTSWDRLEQDRQVDFSYDLPGVARFRVNTFYERSQLAMVLRMIPLDIPDIDTLGLPPVLKDLMARNQGLILVTGPTGSGKSTTLAAMINHINTTRSAHVVTIEDPIEFMYTSEMSTITQRELGIDTTSFPQALRAALRQDPDVILVGEMRDRETIEICISAAETGHLVLSTLHTNDSKQTIDRIIETFPVDQHAQLRSMLSLTIEGILSQRLVKRADGWGRAAVMEIMIGSPNIKQLIAEGNTMGIERAIEKAGNYYRMQSFNQALLAQVHANIVTEEEALNASAAPDDLRLMLRGVLSDTSNTDQFKSSGEMPQVQPSQAAKSSQTAQPAADDVNLGKITINRGFDF